MCSKKIAKDPLYSDPEPRLQSMLANYDEATEKHCRDKDDYSIENKFELLKIYDKATSSFLALKSQLELGRALGHEK